MYNLIKPFRLLERSLENSLDNFNPWFEDWQSYANAPVNVYQQDDKIIVKVEAAGFDKQNFNISLNNSQLSIAGNRKVQFDEQKDKVIQVERKSFSFQRTVNLPQAVDENQINATYKDGILSIELVKTEASQTQPIEVK